MTRTFDPYHQWLGIRPEEHPVDHYRLLGIVRFENDRDVIANACDRLMSHVRTFQTGPRGIYTQEVLTRLSAARACLLDVHAKKTYDAVLHGQLAAAANVQNAEARRTAPLASAYEPATAVLPPPVPLTAPPVASGFSAPPQASVDLRERGAPAPSSTTEEIEYVDRPSPFYLQPWFPVLAVAGALLVALSVWGVVLMIRQEGGEATEVPEDGLSEVETPTTNNPPDAIEPADDDTILIRQEAGGELNFTAGTALVAGNPRLTEQAGHSVITSITSVDDRLRWNFRVEKPGPFRVEATYSAPPGSEGGTFTLSAGEQTTKPITVRNTGAEGSSTTERVGFLWVRRSGKHQLVLAPASLIEGQPLMTFESLRLVPVGGSEGL